MHRLSFLALAGLLCAGPVAPAAAGNDFCDAIAEAPRQARSGGGYDGGRCQVDLSQDRPGLFDPSGRLRLHELRWDALRRRPATAADPIHLWVDVERQNFVDGEAVVEWSFRSDETGEPRLLVLSLWRSTAAEEGVTTRVLAQWYAPRRPDWSLIDPDRALAEAATVVDLSPGAPLSHLDLVFDGSRVTVSVNGGAGYAFALPKGDWQPVRLLNGVLAETPWQAGEGLVLYWPAWLSGP